MTELLVAPAIGWDVSPVFPTNHWNERGPVPDAATLSIVESASETEVSAGCAVIAGGTHWLPVVTVTVTAGLLTEPAPHPLDT